MAPVALQVSDGLFETPVAPFAGFGDDGDGVAPARKWERDRTVAGAVALARRQTITRAHAVNRYGETRNGCSRVFIKGKPRACLSEGVYAVSNQRAGYENQPSDESTHAAALRARSCPLEMSRES